MDIDFNVVLPNMWNEICGLKLDILILPSSEMIEQSSTVARLMLLYSASVLKQVIVGWF